MMVHIATIISEKSIKRALLSKRLDLTRHSSISLMLNNITTQKSLVAMAHHFGHDIETMLKTYTHFFMETEQTLIREFDEIIENERTSSHKI